MLSSFNLFLNCSFRIKYFQYREAEEISADESVSDTCISEAEIRDLDSGSSADKQALQWIQVKDSGLPHGTENLSTSQDNLR